VPPLLRRSLLFEFRSGPEGHNEQEARVGGEPDISELP